MLEQYGMKDCNSVVIPADPNVRLSDDMPTPEGEELDMSKVPFKAAVGSLLYLASATRLDISFAVGQVARKSAKPLPAHWKALKRIFRYVKGTSDLGVWLGGNRDSVKIYCDADFAGDPDDRKSTSGLVSFFHGGPVTWASRKQTLVATSTTTMLSSKR